MRHPTPNEFTKKEPIELPYKFKAPSGIVYEFPSTSIHDQNTTLNAKANNERIIIKAYRFFEDFEREQQALTILGEHPNIIAPLDTFDYHSVYCIAFPYKTGKSLEEHIKERLKEGRRAEDEPVPKRPFSAMFVGAVAHVVGSALTHAHKRNVTHNDIQPGNIHLGTMDAKKLNVYVHDWELATTIGGEKLDEQRSVFGREGYLAPEIKVGENERTVATDVYGFAATLYYALSGQVPRFQVDDRTMKVPSLSNYGVDADVSRIIAKALSFKPQDRFKSVDDLVSAYEEALLGPLR